MSFADKIVVVTGAASGIGAAAVRQFAAEGALVVVADCNRDGGEKVVTFINDSGASGRAVFQQVDVSDAAQVQASISQIAERFGRIDIFVNNAGIGTFGTTPNLPVEEWTRVLAVSLSSVFYCCKSVIPVMRANGGGAIVNVGSISGLSGDYGLAPYNVAKAGVVNYTRTVAIENIRDNIRINCVCPGMVDTEGAAALKAMTALWGRIENQHPRGKASTPDEIASVILFLASEKSAALVGAAVVADGGLTAWTGMPNPLSP